MKYLVFGLAILVGVPVTALVATQYERIRGWMLTALVFSTALGDMGNINFVSMEAYRGPDRGFEINLTDLIAWSLITALILRPQRRILWLPVNSFVFAGFLLIAAVATLSAPVPLLGAFTLFKLWRFFVVYWCVVNCGLPGASTRPLWRGLVLTGIFLTVLALHQKYWLHLYRVQGPFDHSNMIPSFVLLILPALVVWAVADRSLGWGRVTITGLTVVGLLFTIVATFSRAGMGLALVSVVGALLITLRAASRPRLLGAAAILVAALGLGGIKASDSIIDRFLHAPEESMEARRELAAAADHMARDHSFGVGLNHFSYVLSESERYRTHVAVLAHEEKAGVVHDIYRLWAAELGYLGLSLFLLFIGRFAWIALRARVRGRGLEASLLGGFFLGMGALHVTGLLEWTLRTTPVLSLFAVVCGVTVAMARPANGKPRAWPRPQARLQGSQLAFGTGRR